MDWQASVILLAGVFDQILQRELGDSWRFQSISRLSSVSHASGISRVGAEEMRELARFDALGHARPSLRRYC